jgi:VanZ family protein
MARHRSSAVPLAWLYAGLIVYASLYPFTGWRLPGVPWLAWTTGAWPRWWTWFDVVANLLGYLPLGFLLHVGFVRGGRRPLLAAALALALGAALSFALETLQNALPQRISSNLDFGLNAAGVAAGIGVAALLGRGRGIERWQRIRDRWFVARSAGGIALLLLWPIGLLFPTAVPFGLGHVIDRLQGLLADALADTPAEALAASFAQAAADAPVLTSAGEFTIVVLGLLAPCLVCYTVATPGWRRPALAAGAVVVGCTATTLSTALNFGPTHAPAWLTRQTLQALVVGLGAAALLAMVPRRVAAGLGLIAITALVMLVAAAPADPYFAQSLRAWEQGRFIRFHGAAQWVGWVWPYAALAFLLSRLASRESTA